MTTSSTAPSADKYPSLAHTDTGNTFYLTDGSRADVPDAATWEMLSGAGFRDRDVSADELGSLVDAGTLISAERSAAVYHLPDADSRRTYYLARGRLYGPLDVSDSDVHAAVGEAVPLTSIVSDPVQRDRLLESAAPLNTSANGLAILAYLRTIQPPPITAAPGLTLTPGTESPPATYTAAGGVGYSVVSQEQSIQNVVEAFPAVAPVSDVIWPGALVQGGSLASGLLAPVQIEARAPGTLTVTTELVANNPGAPTSATVPAPSLATVTTARQQMLQALSPKASTGRVSLEIATVSSEQQVSARLGTSVSGTGWKASADVNVAGSLDSSRSMLKLTQEFYTVAFDPTGAPAQYFTDAVTVDDVRQYSGPNNAPGYVSQVTYGRVFLFTIDSADSAVKVDSTVKAAWTATVSGDLDLQAQYASATKSYDVQVAAVGVTGATAFRAAGSLMDALKALSDTADYGPANPGNVISYSVRYLLDATVAGAVLGPFSYTAYVRADSPSPTISYAVFDGPQGVPGGKEVGVTLRPGDSVNVTAFGHVWAGWLFGSWFGPEGDTSEHGREIGNGTKPLADVAFSALLYGFGQGWYYWDADHEFVYGETVQKLSDQDPGRTVGSDTAALPMYIHINDDNVKNGKGGFNGQVIIQRRALAAVGQM
jgi:hypothetical protein